ncbi:[4Fe-4S] proteins maturation [Rhodotorula kratochvilovae]
MQRTCTRCHELLHRPARLARPAPRPAAASAAPALVARRAPPASRPFTARAPAHASPLLGARPPRAGRTPLATALASSARRGIVCAAQPPPNPPEDFEPVEEELKDGEKLEINLTDAATKQILRAQAAAKDPSLALRLAVESGGCHGYQYKMQVTSSREADDYLFAAPPGEQGTAALVVDAASLPLVKGATVDYATELIGSAFRIKDNPQSKDAGCWELKDLDL